MMVPIIVREPGVLSMLRIEPNIYAINGSINKAPETTRGEKNIRLIIYPPIANKLHKIPKGTNAIKAI